MHTLDDLQIFPSPTTGTGLNTVGVFSTVYGQVTHVKTSVPASWDDYFYINDGTGYVDGTVDGSSQNIGIRCRPASMFSQQTSVPSGYVGLAGTYYWPGCYVAVTGVMGAKVEAGNTIRYFWTDFFSDPLDPTP